MTYGIDPDALVVTIEAFDEERSRRAGVLCRDHADAMVVPNGWTMDDRRELAPRLFRSRESAKVKPRRRIRRRRLTDDDTGQLRLEVSEADLADAEAFEHSTPRPRLTSVAPWQPVFDQASDLDGLLAARSPLLSRAFGKDKRARNPENETSARPAVQQGRKGERRPS